MSAQPGTWVPEFNSFFTSVFATSGSGTRKQLVNLWRLSHRTAFAESVTSTRDVFR